MAEIKRLTIEITPEEHHQFKILAAAKNKSLKDTILELNDLNELMKKAADLLCIAESLLKVPETIPKRMSEVYEWLDLNQDFFKKYLVFTVFHRDKDRILPVSEDIKKLVKDKQS